MSDAPADPALEAVRNEVLKYERSGELVPGAADALASVMRSHGVLPPDLLAERVARFVGSEEIRRRYADPEHRPATHEDGRPYSPLRRVLSRLAPELREGAVEELARSWAADLTRLDEAGIAREVTRRLRTRDVAEAYLADPPPPPEGERKLADALRRHFPELVSPAATARAWYMDFAQLAHGDEAELVRRAAARLAVGAHAGHTRSGTPLGRDDGRLKYKAPRDPAAPPPRPPSNPFRL